MPWRQRAGWHQFQRPLLAAAVAAAAFGPCRALRGGAPAAAEASSQLMFVELDYHPAAPSAEAGGGGSDSASDFEYIKLANQGPAVADLTGCSFSDGIRFAFALASPHAAVFRSVAPGGFSQCRCY